MRPPQMGRPLTRSRNDCAISNAKGLLVIRGFLGALIVMVARLTTTVAAQNGARWYQWSGGGRKTWLSASEEAAKP